MQYYICFLLVWGKNRFCCECLSVETEYKPVITGSAKQTTGVKYCPNVYNVGMTMTLIWDKKQKITKLNGGGPSKKKRSKLVFVELQKYFVCHHHRQSSVFFLHCRGGKPRSKVYYYSQFIYIRTVRPQLFFSYLLVLLIPFLLVQAVIKFTVHVALPK